MSWVMKNWKPLTVVGGLLGISWFAGKKFDEAESFNADDKDDLVITFERVFEDYGEDGLGEEEQVIVIQSVKVSKQDYLEYMRKIVPPSDMIGDLDYFIFDYLKPSKIHYIKGGEYEDNDRYEGLGVHWLMIENEPSEIEQVRQEVIAQHGGLYEVETFNTESKMDCPPATKDVAINTKNRNATIKNFGYGPLNVEEPGDFWKDIAKQWKTTEKAAKKSKCGNCVAFDRSPRMKDCMPGETSDGEGVLGYCWMHHFKCHSARTCDTWAKGGPITTDKVSEGWQERAFAKSEKKEAETDVHDFYYPFSVFGDAFAVDWDDYSEGVEYPADEDSDFGGFATQEQFENNNGYPYGVFYLENGYIIEKEWFATPEERDKNLKSHNTMMQQMYAETFEAPSCNCERFDRSAWDSNRCATCGEMRKGYYGAETFEADYDEEDMVHCNHCWNVIGNEKQVYGDETVDYEMANGEVVCVPCYKRWMKEYENDMDMRYTPFYADTVAFESFAGRWDVGQTKEIEGVQLTKVSNAYGRGNRRVGAGFIMEYEGHVGEIVANDEAGYMGQKPSFYVLEGGTRRRGRRTTRRGRFNGISAKDQRECLIRWKHKVGGGTLVIRRPFKKARAIRTSRGFRPYSGVYKPITGFVSRAYTFRRKSDGRIVMGKMPRQNEAWLGIRYDAESFEADSDSKKVKNTYRLGDREVREYADGSLEVVMDAESVSFKSFWIVAKKGSNLFPAGQVGELRVYDNGERTIVLDNNIVIPFYTQATAYAYLNKHFMVYPKRGKADMSLVMDAEGDHDHDHDHDHDDHDHEDIDELIEKIDRLTDFAITFIHDGGFGGEPKGVIVDEELGLKTEIVKYVEGSMDLRMIRDLETNELVSVRFALSGDPDSTPILYLPLPERIATVPEEERAIKRS